MSKLKVYRWVDVNIDCPRAQNGSQQCEHVCATTSMAELVRITGLSRHMLTTYGSVTGNAESIAVAMASPGTVFWKAEHWQGKPGPKEWKVDRHKQTKP